MEKYDVIKKIKLLLSKMEYHSYPIYHKNHSLLMLRRDVEGWVKLISDHDWPDKKNYDISSIMEMANKIYKQCKDN